jgi:lipoprotein NlpI
MALATDNDKQTEAHAYLGLDLVHAGKREAAREHLEWVVANGNKDFLEVQLAAAELKRLNAAPASPAP